ncbi:protein FREE1-like [Lycium ferocissimum]|uniref:protein FREE1-like n=1 Tax=Lycium ferocissimum TaxID=112874 RepID=UPI00281500F0|nr:protein FREE1-like [Lycium ferocissimum]
MQHGDVSSAYYQYYQPHFPNPNPTDQPYTPAAAVPGQFASAPPVASGDYSNYAATYPPYSDHAPNPPAPFPSNPSSQSTYGFPHLEAPQPNYYPYDQNQPPVNYDFAPPNPPSYNSLNSSAPYSSTGTNYGNSFENNANYGSYGGDQGLYDGGVYKYNGKKEESYSSGNRSQSSSGLMFDDYGRPINVDNSGREQQQGRPVNTPTKVVKATPKIEDQQDVTGGVLKFRVKLLSEGIGQTDMDVLCQIGLDGIRILDPATSRTQRIYSLENVTRWEVLDSYIFAFWAKTSVDFEAKRIRLKSNSYTTNNILDAVTAASIQVKEMGESSMPSDAIKGSESAAEKKKGFDWMKLMRPLNEEKDHWVPDEAVRKCTACGTDFGAFVRRHHCRNCGDIFCDKCTQGRTALTADEDAQPVRVCDRCMAEVTQRLSNSKAAVRVAALPSHVDLAKKLQEEMDKKRKTSIGHTSEGSRRMREVACPTCTVHLQVEVPASGSETIECSVCQQPFLVSAH